MDRESSSDYSQRSSELSKAPSLKRSPMSSRAAVSPASNQPHAELFAKLGKKNSIDNILANEQLLKEFAKFLAKEYCLENLLFIQRVMKYKQMFLKDGVDKATQLWLDIMNEFILPNSPNNINIPSNVLKILLEDYKLNKNIDFKTFDGADEHIRKMMMENNIVRFSKFLVGNKV